jgi:hypothetical protein
MKLPKISAVTHEQQKKVVKALAYAFISTFITTLLVAPDISQIDQRLLVSALVAGVNAVLVVVKQLFTEAK